MLLSGLMNERESFLAALKHGDVEKRPFERDFETLVSLRYQEKLHTSLMEMYKVELRACFGMRGSELPRLMEERESHGTMQKKDMDRKFLSMSVMAASRKQRSGDRNADRKFINERQVGPQDGAYRAMGRG